MSPEGLPSPIADGLSDGSGSSRSGSGGRDGAGGGGEGAGGLDKVVFSPVDEDAPGVDRLAKMGLERHVRIVK